MVLGIFTLMLLSTIGLIVTIVDGYLAQADSSHLLRHITLGLPSTLLVLFTHSLILFYFIGSGKTLKEAVEANQLSRQYIDQTKRFKRITSPLATYTMLLTVGMAILGGAAQVGKLSPRWHEVCAWATLFLHLWACWQEARCLISNQLLANDAVQEIRKLQTNI